jgi:predicted RNase H-like nuclease
MPLVAGADGCRGYWICVTKDTITGAIAHRLYPTAKALIFQNPIPDVLMIDIPIGLTNGHGRQCDAIARALLGNRHVCVFAAPIRPALQAATRQQASQITHAIDGRNVGCQAWAIVPKISEVDAVLSANLGLQKRVFEVHPEVCFYEWNGGAAYQQKKKSPAGRAARQALIGQGLFSVVRNAYAVGQVGHDDIADAIAALWTAERKLLGRAVAIPANPPVDQVGLRMEIWR